ncbi:hypothetical protein ACFC7A_31600 [Streptomyces niveus]|uniref:hypothetical protein n=1 Tax=Streptomyces niveus TaxID=193462 RepID=UPI0035D8E88E
MTSRQFTADTTGPVTLDAALLGGPGTIIVRAEPTCRRAVVTVSTREEGPAADAVRLATTQFSDGRLQVGVHVEEPAGSGDPTVVVTGRRRTSYGGLTMRQRFIGAGREIAPVEIAAVVPEGSSVTCRSDSADIETTGALADITADIRSGHVGIGSLLGAANIYVRTGSIRVHATGHRTHAAGLRLTAWTGNITVTADRSTLDSGLNVDAATRSGTVSTPQTALR